MKVQHDISIVHTTHPFVIARGGASEHRLIRVRIIDDDGVEGWGEAAPNRFYGETVDTALGALARLAPIVERCDPWALEDVELEMNRALRFNGSVKSAISAALHDLAGKRLGVPSVQAVGTRSDEGAAVELHDRDRRDRRRTARARRAGGGVSGAQGEARHRSRRADHSHGARGGADQGAARRRERGVDGEARARHDRRARRVRRRVRRAAACRARSRRPALRSRTLGASRDRRRVVRRVDRHRAARRRRGRHQHQAVEVRRASRSAEE